MTDTQEYEQPGDEFIIIPKGQEIFFDSVEECSFRDELQPSFPLSPEKLAKLKAQIERERKAGKDI